MQYCDEFMEYMKHKNYARKTMEWYRDTIQECDQVLDSKPERTVTESDISRYIEYLHGKDISINTVYKAIVTVRKYFTYLVNHDRILVNPMLHVELPRQVESHNTCLTVDEVITTLNSIKTDDDQGIQERTIFEVLYSTAMRPGELPGVKMNDVDFDEGFMVVRDTKTKRDRTVPVGKTALFWLRQYVSEVRVKYQEKLTHDRLFFSMTTFLPLTYSKMEGLLKRCLKRNSIKPFNLYALRVSSATHLMQNGASFSAIQKLLGHVRIEATIRYLKVSLYDLKKQMMLYHPGNKKRIKGVQT